ncbi:hypothetical protein MRX96_040252 [Rhipicephalus microplus]
MPSIGTGCRIRRCLGADGESVVARIASFVGYVEDAEWRGVVDPGHLLAPSSGADHALRRLQSRGCGCCGRERKDSHTKGHCAGVLGGGTGPRLVRVELLGTSQPCATISGVPGARPLQDGSPMAAPMGFAVSKRRMSYAPLGLFCRPFGTFAALPCDGVSMR